MIKTETTYKKYLLFLIIFSFVFRCMIASAVELGNDEVYYYTYALQPDWNHFDHPPVVGLLIKLTTFNLNWLSDLNMRMGAIICCAICTWLIFLCGKLIANERVGWYAALLYNTSFYASIIAGLFILPDSPQMVFWLASLFLMLKIILYKNTNNGFTFILLGLMIGLTVMSKIHGIFLWLGFGAYILFNDRKLLKNPYLYLSILTTIIVVSPILIWNINYDFITFKFHGERVEVNKFKIDLQSFLTTFIGQILYNNPINFIIYILTFLQLRKIDFPYKTKTFLLWISIPIIVTTTLVSLFRTTLPHWSGPGFIGVMLLSAFVMDSIIKKRKTFTVLLKISAGIIVVVLFAGVWAVNFFPGTLNPNKDVHNMGKFDFTLDMYGWEDFGKQFRDFRNEEITKNPVVKYYPLVVENWFPSSHLLYYVVRKDMNVKALGELKRLHKFAWLNKNQTNIEKGANAYYIATSSFYIDPVENFGYYFNEIELKKIVTQKRGNKIARYFFIYLLKNAREEIQLTPPTKITL